MNSPAPVVVRLPLKVMSPFSNEMFEAAMVKLLKFSVPAPLTEVPVPLSIMVLVLPLNVPILTQLPLMLCV